MRYPFSLSRRVPKASKRPIFYIQRWNPNLNKYDTARSAAALVEELRLDPELFSPYQKAGARMIAEKWLDSMPLAPQVETLGLLGEYLLNFWDWEQSDYVAGKLARRPGSIGKAHVANNLSWVKRYALPVLGKTRIDAVTTSQLEKWRLGLTRSTGLVNRTVNQVFQSVRLPIREAFRLGLIEKDPSASIQPLGEVDVEKGILTNSEVKALLSLTWSDNQAYTAFCVAICGGLRLGEIQALRASDMRADHLVVAHSYSKVVGLKGTKTSKTRIVTLPDRVLGMLTELVKANPHGEDWVFWRRQTPGVPAVERNIERGFYQGLEAIGIPDDPRDIPAPDSRQGRRLTFHSLRHWFTATLHGVLPGEKLRLLTGHQTEEMTRRYDHVTESDRATMRDAQQARIEVLFPKR